MQLSRGESGVAKLLEMTDTFIDGPSFNPDPQCNNPPSATTTMSVSESRMIDTARYYFANTMHVQAPKDTPAKFDRPQKLSCCMYEPSPNYKIKEAFDRNVDGELRLDCL